MALGRRFSRNMARAAIPRPASGVRARGFNPADTGLGLSVTSSSAAVGWTATVRSKSSLVAPIFTATPASWIISAAPWPTMCSPRMRRSALATIIFISMRSSRPAGSRPSGGRRCGRSPRPRGAGLGLGQPDGADLGLGEHRARHEGVVGAGRARIEHRVGEGLPLADRDRGQREPVGHVAHRDRSTARGTATSRPPPPRRWPPSATPASSSPSPPVCGTRPWRRARSRPAGCRPSVRRDGAPRPACRRSPRHPCPSGCRSPWRASRGRRDRARRRRSRAGSVAAVDLRDLGAEAVQDAGELAGDVAPAHDHRALGPMGQVEDLVRGDGVMAAGKVRHEGRARRWRSGCGAR